MLCTKKEKSIAFSTKCKNHKDVPKYNLNKFVIWCVRNSNDHKKTNINLNSAPCEICVTRLIKFGFNKMGYSNNNGEMVMIKLSEYKNKSYRSSSQKKCIENIKI